MMCRMLDNKQKMIEQIDYNFKKHAAYLPSFCNIMQVLEEEGLTYIDSGLKSDTFNIIHIHEGKIITKKGLEKATSFYENRLRESCIWISGKELTENVKEIFAATEIIEADVNKGFWADIEILTHSKNKNIKRTENRQDIIDNAFVVANNWDPFDINVLHYFNHVHTSILEKEDTILFNYYEEGVVVGVIELFVDDHQVGGIYNLSVMKENRQQGIGRQLVEYAIDYAKQFGVKRIVTQASKDSENIFKKVGFQEEGVIYEFCKK